MENHTPGDAVSHGECPGVRLPGARPANTSPGQHHPTAELHETTAERAPEVGRKAPHTSGKTKLRAGPGGEREESWGSTPRGWLCREHRRHHAGLA